jgi:hypothetical protein
MLTSDAAENERRAAERRRLHLAERQRLAHMLTASLPPPRRAGRLTNRHPSNEHRASASAIRAAALAAELQKIKIEEPGLQQKASEARRWTQALRADLELLRAEVQELPRPQLTTPSAAAAAFAWPSAAATAFASPSAAATAFASPPKPPLLEQRLGPLVDALNRSIPSTIDATEILQLAEEMACAAAHTAALEAASEAAHLAARAGAQLAARTVAQAAEEERAAEQQERAAAERATQRAEERAAVREAEHESRAREGQRGRTELGQQLERAHAAHAEALARAAEQARAATRATEEAEARAAAAQAEATARRAEAAQLRAELESAHAQNQAVLALAAEQASEQAARAAQQQRQAVEQATRAARARADDEVAVAREAAEAATDGLLKAQAQLAEAGRRHQALLDELPVTIRAVVDMALARDLRSELAAGVQHALAQLMPQMQRETEAALRAEASSSSSETV